MKKTMGRKATKFTCEGVGFMAGKNDSKSNILKCMFRKHLK